MSLIAVTGMQREARCFAPGGEVIVAGADNSTLAGKIEAAIARGGHAILSAGICGGLRQELAVGTTLIASEVIDAEQHYEADPAWRDALLAELNGTRGAVLGSDTMLVSPAMKAEAHAQTGAIAADMESHIAARVAAEHGLPFAVLRVVSDGADDALPPAALTAMTVQGRLNVPALARSLLKSPSQIPALIRTGRSADRAFAELLRGLRLLGPGLGCPHLG